MFYLPGGIQGYLLFNILAVPVLLVGYKKVVEVSPQATKYAYFCASLGGLTFVIHAFFLVFGYEQFTLPLSFERQPR